MPITHEVLQDGRVHILRSLDDDGMEVEVCMIEQGDYDFGSAQRREDIHVVAGAIIDANGLKYNCLEGILVFKKGETRVFKVTESGTVYLCEYDDLGDEDDID
ncbi:MAG: hypothetical protein PHS79_01220 [Patescibacteria group bacterium]|nr:hypothetical protein [Patescibacteria group bacterium]